ncbi:Hypothetical protein FKW44_001035 [Caligus rogercresseyi]|uniref:Uncharacterized protein n=1 Tax=Caligus rogercresseyi TaxID=217165 RepID=A0A7T8QVC9_CALRO|nr:Hypothetical protein FKW44_001035 [Caligus rogercresseyi]
MARGLRLNIRLIPCSSHSNAHFPFKPQQPVQVSMDHFSAQCTNPFRQSDEATGQVPRWVTIPDSSSLWSSLGGAV